MQNKIEDSAFAPSFNCYSSDSTTSTAITKVIREEEEEEEEEIGRFHLNGDVEGDDFEFSLSDEETSVKQIDPRDSTVFPVFTRHLLVNRGIKPTDDAIDACFAITGSLQKLFIGESEESSSYSSSSSDAYESETPRYCVWMPKADGGSSPVIITRCKKSRSTGSGSKRWILFRYLLRRSNSQCNKPTVKKADSPKHKRINSGENSKFDGRWKAKTPVHQQFYGRKREEEKRKTYLPYRKDLVGLFANVNGMGKMLSF